MYKKNRQIIDVSDGLLGVLLFNSAVLCFIAYQLDTLLELMF